jgi:hypothetical protein
MRRRGSGHQVRLVGMLADSMIGPCDVGNILGANSRLVATGAVGIRRVVLGGVFNLGMTGEAPGTEEGHAFFGRRRDMRILAAHAGHAGTAGDPASTGLKLFNLADGAPGGVLACVDEVEDEVADVVTRLVVKRGTPAVFVEESFDFEFVASRVSAKAVTVSVKRQKCRRPPTRVQTSEWQELLLRIVTLSTDELNM